MKSTIKSFTYLTAIVCISLIIFILIKHRPFKFVSLQTPYAMFYALRRIYIYYLSISLVISLISWVIYDKYAKQKSILIVLGVMNIMLSSIVTGILYLCVDETSLLFKTRY